MQGKVKWYNAAKGFGFIQGAPELGDIFVHYSALPKADQHLDLTGKTVVFECVTDPRGPQAFNVEVKS